MKNTFLDYGYSKEEIENRVNDTFYAIFEGINRFYSGYAREERNN